MKTKEQSFNAVWPAFEQKYFSDCVGHWSKPQIKPWEDHLGNFLIRSPWNETVVVYRDGTFEDIPGEVHRDGLQNIRDWEPSRPDIEVVGIATRCIAPEFYSCDMPTLRLKAIEFRRRLADYRSHGAETFFHGAEMQRGPVPAEPEKISTYEKSWSGALVSVDIGTAYYACCEGQPPRRLDHPAWESGSNYAHSSWSSGEGKAGLDPMNPGEHLVLVSWGFNGHHNTSGHSVNLLNISAAKWAADQTKGKRHQQLRANIGTWSNGVEGLGVYHLPNMEELRERAASRASERRERERQERLAEHAQQRAAHRKAMQQTQMNPLFVALQAVGL